MTGNETLGELQVRLRKLKGQLAVDREVNGDEEEVILQQIAECRAEIFQRRGGEPTEAEMRAFVASEHGLSDE